MFLVNISYTIEYIYFSFKLNGVIVLDIIGWFCLMILLCYSSYPGKVKKLESKVKKLERKLGGGSRMSNIIKSLIGNHCIIRTEDALIFSGNIELNCTVLDADDEWIKITFKDKKGMEKTKILRIDSIDSIELN